MLLSVYHVSSNRVHFQKRANVTYLRQQFSNSNVIIVCCHNRSRKNSRNHTEKIDRVINALKQISAFRVGRTKTPKKQANIIASAQFRFNFPTHIFIISDFA